MQKYRLLFLTILLAAPMLSGCFCPYWSDWGGDRGHGYGGGYHGNRGYSNRH